MHIFNFETYISKPWLVNHYNIPWSLLTILLNPLL